MIRCRFRASQRGEVVGGLLLSGIFAWAAGLAGEFLVLGPVFGLAGAGCAAGSLALARMAEERGALDARADAAQAELSESRARDLLEDGG